jgi:hypothetical protein
MHVKRAERRSAGGGRKIETKYAAVDLKVEPAAKGREREGIVPVFRNRGTC